ncbi:MAG: hypothetical protein CHACPFDD_00529 [Phycisphaerae bacterium]|nr:hypothetical protein [Phycisphaerae bacterium]
MKTQAFVAALSLALAQAGIASAQDDNTPPEIVSITWLIAENIGGVPEGPYTSFATFDPNTDLAHELDLLVATLEIFDPDFSGDGSAGGDDQVFVRFQAFWVPVPGYLTPEPGPVTQAMENFFPEDGDGFSPPAGDTLFLDFLIQIPSWTGRNQARMRGLIDFDVRFLFEFCVTNDQDPGEESIINCETENIFCIENPAMLEPNPPAFADAGPDQTVAAGTTVKLDGSRTFDGTNVGFGSESDNVIDKDTLTFAWEWISGPERVEPTATDRTPISQVTLNALGTYVYRLTVDDNASDGLPSSDEVAITVVAAIPPNRPPVALATGPSSRVTVGSTIILDGTRSFDPDGDAIAFTWQQTDEVGARIDASEFGRFFQPLSGLEQPIVVWQATTAGTFYFRLLVDDGELVDAERITVEVVEGAAAGAFASRGGAAASSASDSSSSEGEATSTSGCGAGGLLPLGLTPLTLLGMYRRRGR